MSDINKIMEAYLGMVSDQKCRTRRRLRQEALGRSGRVS